MNPRTAAMHPHAIALVTSAMRQRPLCLHCIASIAGSKDADAVLTTIGRVVQVRWHHKTRCQACGHLDGVYSLDEPAK